MQQWLERFWREFRQEAHGERTLGFARQIWENDRWGDFAHFHQTAERVAQWFDQFGLADVERVDIPADGKHRLGDWVMPLAWDCNEAVIEIVEPVVDEPLLARRSDVPNVAAQWCAPTAPEGLTAECVFLRRGDPAELEPLDVRGKLVCTVGRARAIRGLLAKKAAAGCITSWTRNEQLADATPWVNVASDKPGGWGLTHADSRQVTLAISKQQMHRLAHLAEQHGRLRLRVNVDARLYEGTLPFVTARLTGSTHPQQEVIVLGHLFEQGANDNASGCATVLEIARALAALVKAGRLDQPQRSIRFLLMGESYGSLAYALRHPDRMKQTLAGLCIDTGAGPPELSRCPMRITATPLCSRTFLDAWHQTVAQIYRNHHQPLRAVQLESFSMSTDQLFNDPAIGVATNWTMIPSRDDVWHCSADRLETLDTRAYEDLTSVEAATLYGIANAGAQDASFLAELTAAHELGQLDRQRKNHLLAGQPPPTEGVAAVLAEAVQRAVQSAQRLAAQDSAAHARIEAAAQAALHQAQARAQHWTQAARRLSDGGHLREAPTPSSAHWEEQAESIVPRRNPQLLGSVSLDTVPFERWADGGVHQSPRWGGPLTLAWWWADGRRNLRQIRDAVLAEGVSLEGLDLIQYFQFLSKCGHVTLRET